jgi:hypothetical protein
VGKLYDGPGVNKQINCYSLLPWNNEVHYFDESKNELVNVIAKPGTAIFEELWTPFLKDFSKHITAKGWLKITNIAMDERGREEMDPAIALLEKVAPEFGVAFADNHKSYQRYHKSTDISVAAGDPFDQKDLIERRKRVYHDILCLLFGRIPKSIHVLGSSRIHLYGLVCASGRLRWSIALGI